MSGNLDVVVHESASVCKVWVFGIDVSQLDRHQVVNLEHNATIYRKIDLHLNYFYRNCLCRRLRKMRQTISLVTGSLFLSRDVTTSTMASCSFGNLSSS